MAYGFTAKIDIDNTKVSGSANLSNFPVLISGTYDGTGTEPDIRTVANGGNVENTASGGASGSLTVPADLAFYDDASGTTQYDHEIEYYNAATGEIVAWVRIPSLLYNSDTTLYMHYGDGAVSTSQENLAGVWQDYVAVWHFGIDPTGSAGDVYDSSGNGHHGTSQGSMGSAVNGQIGKGLEFNGSSQYIIIPDSDALTIWDTGDTASLSFWMNQDAETGLPTVFDKLSEWSVRLFDGSDTAGEMAIGVYTYGDNNTAAVVDSVPIDSWTLGYVTMNESSNTVLTYTNNEAAQSDTAVTDTSTNTTNDLYIGKQNPNNDLYWDGTLDELRITTLIRSSDWIATEYNSQNSPSTFYTMGDETAAGGGGGGGRTAVSSRTAAGSRELAGARTGASSRTAVS